MNWLRRLQRAPVTLALIAANLLVYASMAIASHSLSGFDYADMIYGGVNIVGTPQDVSHWRWLTAAFVHFNLLHLAVNLWTLGQIGAISEQTIGSGLIAATYVTTGIFGNLASALYHGWRHQPRHTAGASGAILGLIGLVAAYAWRTDQKGIARALVTNLVVLLVLGQVLNFDNATHLGGFFAGGVIGLARARWPAPLPRRWQVAMIAASALLIVAAFAIVHSYKGYH
jgi:rhomboid protease GluP